MNTYRFTLRLSPGWCLLLLATLAAAASAQDTLSLSERDAATRASTDNPVVLAAHLGLRASEKQLSGAWRQYSPTITANARYTYLNDDLALGIPAITLPLPPRGLTLTLDPIHLLDRSTLRADFTATLPLFTGLRIESGIRAARHLVQEATAEDSLALQKTVAEGLVDYQRCLLADANVRAREEAYATVSRHHHEVGSLRVQGIATQYDLIRADLAVAEADRALEEARTQRVLAYRMLKKTLALPEGTVLTLSDSLCYRPCSLHVEDAVAEAQSARPEKAVIREKQEEVRALSCVEKGKMLPQIGAFAVYELNRNALTQLDPRWAVGISASFTIFNGLKDLASGQVYDIQESKLNALQQEATNAVDLEVRRYYTDLQTAEHNIRSSQTALALAHEALRMADRRFETGTGTSLEVIDAQTSLVASRTGLAAALFSYDSSYVQLLRAMGRTADLLNGAL